jgi:hypothetical protein
LRLLVITAARIVYRIGFGFRLNESEPAIRPTRVGRGDNAVRPLGGQRGMVAAGHDDAQRAYGAEAVGAAGTAAGRTTVQPDLSMSWLAFVDRNS